MKIRLLLFVLFLLAVKSQAQKAPIKFGDVSIDELKMVRYDKDTSASGLVIADYGESSMLYDQKNGFMVRFDRIRRIKIFKKDAYSFAEYDIPVYHRNGRFEKVSSLKAVTYNLEGGKIIETKMKAEGTFNERINDNWNRVKFTLPNVKEGSVIEIAYTILSEYIFNFHSWEFQSTIPTRWSEYRARIPNYFEYRKVMQGYVQPTITDLKQVSDMIQITSKETSEGSISQTTFDSDEFSFIRNDHRWVAQNVPAFIEEPRMNNTVDYISKIDFELIFQKLPGRSERSFVGTWENLNSDYLTNTYFGIALNNGGFLKGTTDDLIKDVTDLQERMVRIFNYVRGNVEWDGGYRMYMTEDLRKVVNDKKGSSADMNLLMTAMLRNASIMADPVLISTRNHGFIRKQTPSSDQFNYVIVAVTIGDKTILLDATERTLPIHVLPERCFNGEGFVISEKNSRWIPIIPKFKSRTISSFDLSLNDDGEMSGTFSIARDGYDAQRMRESYKTKGEENYLNTLASSSQWELQKSKFENTNELNESVKENHEIKIPQHVQQSGDIMYMNPLIIGKIEENPFKSETRTYPVDFGSPTEQIIMGKFVVPEGYAVEELPKPKIFMLPNAGAKYVYNLSQIGNKIQFTSQLSVNQSIFPTEEYTNLREFYNQIMAKQNEQIVIKKK